LTELANWEDGKYRHGDSTFSTLTLVIATTTFVVVAGLARSRERASNYLTSHMAALKFFDVIIKSYQNV